MVSAVATAVATFVAEAFVAASSWAALDLVVYWGAYYLTVGTITAVAMGLTQKLLASSDEAAPSTANALADRKLTLRNSIASRQMVYGQTRKGGTVIFEHATGSSKEYLHLVIVLADHQIEEIGQCWVDGAALIINARGDAVTIDKNGKVITGTADATTAAQIAALTAEQKTEAATLSYGNLIHIEKRLGTTTQTAFDGLVSYAPDKWTSAHQMKGCAGVYVRLKYDSSNLTSVPNLTFDLKGKNDIYDPRTATTGYTDNAALCTADYLKDTRFGLGATDEEIPDDELIIAANACDELVTKKDGTTEARYTMGGVIETSSNPSDIITDLAAAMGGYAIVTSGNRWRILPGVYRSVEPGLDFTIDDLRGPVKVSTRISRRTNYNGVKGVYCSPTNEWEAADYPQIQVSDYVDDDGQEIWGQLDLPMTTSASMAQRIARIALERMRRQITVDATFSMRAWRATPGDNITLTLDRYGWDQKVFEVAETKLATDDTGAITVVMSLREIDQYVFAWDIADEQTVAQAPTTDLPSPLDIPEPLSITVSDAVVTLGSGSPATNMIVVLEEPNYAFITGYEVQYRKSESPGGTWISAGSGTSTSYTVTGVEDGVTYEARARSLGKLANSDWLYADPYTIVGQDALPADVEDYAVNIVGAQANHSWTAVADVDLSHYRIRWSPLTDGTATWNSMVDLVTKVSKPATSVSTAALSGTFAIKAVDYKGNESENAAVYISTLASVQGLNFVEALQEEAPDFTGDCYGACYNSAVGGLTIEGAGIGLLTDGGDTLVTDAGDAILGNSSTGYEASGRYVMPGWIDLLGVFTFRASAEVDAYGVGVPDQFGLLTDGNDQIVTDAGDRITGPNPRDVSGGSWNVAFQIETTNDDPAGSPVTTSGWSNFIVGDYTARAARLAVVLTGTPPQITPVITRIYFQLDMEDRVVAFSATIPAGGATIAFDPAFYVVPAVGISVEDGQEGDVYTRTVLKDRVSFAFTNGGSPVERTISGVAKGYGEAA